MGKSLLPLIALVALTITAAHADGQRWSEGKANQWAQKHGWIVGANFVPSTAQNQIEMWQASTFDPVTINWELGYAEKIGMNSMRVFMHYLVWKEDPEGFYARMDHFLNICKWNKIKPMMVFFDDVWNPYPRLGNQGVPHPRRHNAGWVQCPGWVILSNDARHNELKPYVQGIMKRFANDGRILAWDLYNEPENNNCWTYNDEGKQPHSLKLLKEAFEWAREVDPSQPITAAVWNGDWSDPENLSDFNQFMLDHSDIITFHNYDDIETFKAKAGPLKRYNRPVLCTEYMGRTNKSTFETHLPYLFENGIGAYNWGLVDGKSQTIFPWDSWTKDYPAEPNLWLHDIFRKGGTPYNRAETELIKKLTDQAKDK